MRPAPTPDRDGQPWWEGLARGELLVQRCERCGRLRWPPRALCGECGALEWAWQTASGAATVASWVVNHHAFGDAFPVPYVVVTGRLAEQDDILIPAGFEGDRDALVMGAALVAGF
ncbi:MAG TPA: zinc ribbon domain-containing protein, partial [Acidimicrobiales bacterium]|nr:zinc ribbon domain-containing protein [Acidimicrobiales bacterium]